MWYYAKDGQQLGPVADEELRRMIRDGSLRQEDLVWRDGMPSWQPAGEVPDLGFLPPAPYPPPPPEGPVTQAGPANPYAPPRAPAPYGAPLPYQTPGADIPDYLPWSIAATLLCCMPCGIAAIIYSTKANTAKAKGDLEEARQAASRAKMWLIVSVVVGLVTTALILLASVAGQLNHS